MKTKQLFENYFKRRENKSRNINKEQTNFNQLIRCLKELEVNSVNNIDFDLGEKVITWFKANTKSKNNTINKNVGYLKTVLRINNYTDNSFLLVENLKSDTQPFVAVDSQDFIKILQWAKNRNTSENSFVYYAMLQMLYDTGCRITELLSIQKQNIMINDGIISLEASDTKTSKQRFVFFSESKKEIIQKLIEQSPSNYIFWNQIRNRRISYDDVKIFYRTLREETGIKRFHSHQIRKRMSTDLVVEGANLKTVQTILGHADQATTEIYVNYSAINAKKEYDKIKNK